MPERRGLYLERDLPAQERAGGDREEAQRRDGFGDAQPAGQGAARGPRRPDRERTTARRRTICAASSRARSRSGRGRSRRAARPRIDGSGSDRLSGAPSNHGGAQCSRISPGAKSRRSGARIVTVYGGNGPPLLLMHGNPFTHASWHKFAPRLAQDFTVVCTDLRGYGDSEKPPGGADHSGYSFRAMAQDQVEVMAALGFDRFMAAGHDRGARVLARMTPRSSRQGARRPRSSTSCRSTTCSITSPRNGRPGPTTGSS